ncbi:hypothetical protein Fot_30876 [Forsythia ovata]|uniref:Uncharacterized protein n=1 Tax=Forsythia ovata TaxID=205694 RepID=A0ABD1T3C7_9LAMI
MEWDPVLQFMQPSFHVIKMGLTNQHYLPNSQKIVKNGYQDIINMMPYGRAKGYKEIFEHVTQIITEKEKIWIYPSKEHIIYSNARITTKEEDICFLDHLLSTIISNQVSGSEDMAKELCKILWDYSDHHCEHCVIEDMSQASLNSEEFPMEFFDSRMEK